VKRLGGVAVYPVAGLEQLLADASSIVADPPSQHLTKSAVA
jgi:hypothetical protein